MYAVIKMGDEIEPYIMEFIVDSIADIKTLPKPPKCASGSSCLVLENSSIWILGMDKEWKEI